MQGLIAILIVLAPLTAFVAGEKDEPVALSGSLAVGGGYESDVARSQGTLGAREGAGALSVEASGEMTLYDETVFGASFLYDLIPAYGGRYTRMVFGTTADWYHDFGTIEMDLGVAGEMSFIDRFDPEPYFGLFEGYAELVIPHGVSLEWLVTLTGAYQHGLRDDVAYLRGPDVFLQGAVRWYFAEEKGMLAGGYRGGVSLREDAGLYDIAGLAESGYITLTACNEHFEQALFVKASYDLDPLMLIGRFSAIHRYAFAKDEWATLYERTEKRRIELVFVPSVEARWSPVESFEAAVQYDLEYTVSSLGKGDYYDLNGLRHSVRVVATQRF